MVHKQDVKEGRQTDPAAQREEIPAGGTASRGPGGAGGQRGRGRHRSGARVCATVGAGLLFGNWEVTGLLEAGGWGGLSCAGPDSPSPGLCGGRMGRPDGRGVGQGAGGRRLEGGPTAPRPIVQRMIPSWQKSVFCHQLKKAENVFPEKQGNGTPATLHTAPK